MVAALIGSGVVVLFGAGVWGWTAWSSRSSPQIDDQLPFLINAESATESSASSPPDDVVQGATEPTPDLTAGAQLVVPTGAPGVDEVVGADQEPLETPAAPTPTEIIVHVSGAVMMPGVVELPQFARVYEAVEALGGVTDEADLERVNLAAPLHDGERVHIPRIGQYDVPQLVAPERSAGLAGVGDAEFSTTVAPGSEPAVPLRVDINRASVTEFEQLPGVGPAIAQAIVDLRDQRGPFAAVDELELVSGVGPAKLSALRPFAYVEAYVEAG